MLDAGTRYPKEILNVVMSLRTREGAKQRNQIFGQYAQHVIKVWERKISRIFERSMGSNNRPQHDNIMNDIMNDIKNDIKNDIMNDIT